MNRTVLLGMLALFLVPQAQAAINGDHAYAASLPYQAGLGTDSGSFTLLSGSLDAKMPDVKGPYGFFQTDEARLTGLTRVCFQTVCYASTSGQLSIVIANGGSFGVKFPKATSSEAHADHVLGLLVDFGGKRDLNSFSLGKTLMAPAILGRFGFTQLPSIPATTGIPDAVGARPNAGGLVALDDKTRIQVLDGTLVKATFPAGKQDPIAFQGQPALNELHPSLMVLPFESGSTAHMAPARQDAADVGLDLQRIAGLGNNLNQASKVGGSADAPSLSLGPLEPLLSHLLNGAVLTLPTKTSAGNPVRQLGFVRFDTLDASSDGSAVALAGSGPLQVQDGQVVDAKPLVGFAIFQMPWWSYLLWIAAIGLFVARLVTKPPKDHPVFDRYRWVGLVCSVLLFLLFFWLWDLEVRAVWGISLLTGNASGESFMVLAALELAPMFAVLFAVVAPIRMILKNGVLLARGGRFMGLPGAFAYPLGFIFGAPLLLAYLNLGLRTVAGT
ncbi:MAG: hypothetical protein QOG31_520 [Thermoplasmata archaeon]|jgi:hypothetical protein|nr:hypothetical protein [Thermoplasmata archaeon]